eukprot:UN02890
MSIQRSDGNWLLVEVPLKLATHCFLLLSQLFMYALHFFKSCIVCCILFCLFTTVLSMLYANWFTCLVVFSLQQSFDPIIEAHTGRDLIPEMVHGRRPKEGMPDR